MRIDELIHALGLPHRLPLAQYMNVVGVGVSHSEYRVRIVSQTRQSNQRPVVREPDGMRLGCDAVFEFDAHLDLYCSQRTPAITPPVLSRVIRVEGELIHHRAL